MSTTSLNVPWKEHIGDITSVVIESGITTVGSFAFRNCNNLVSVSLPDTVTSIKKNAFKGCSSLKNISFPARLKNIERNAFTDCSAIQEVSFSNTLISMGESAFEGCSSLEKAIIPDSVNTIEDYAFDSCSINLVIYCTFGSTAFSYAKSAGLKYDDPYSFDSPSEETTAEFSTELATTVTTLEEIR